MCGRLEATARENPQLRIGYRIQNGKKLPLRWSYSDAFSTEFDPYEEVEYLVDRRRAGFQFWPDVCGFTGALLGEDRDGTYPGRYVVLFAYREWSDGVGEWSVLRPSQVLETRVMPHKQAVDLVTNAALSTSARGVAAWCARRPRVVEQMLWERATPIRTEFVETLPVPRSYAGMPRRKG